MECKSIVYSYVGETERELRERMPEHMRNVRLERDKNRYIFTLGKGERYIFTLGKGEHTQNDLSFVVLERLYGADRKERQFRE